MNRFYGQDMRISYSIEPAVHKAVFQLTTEIWKNFQGMSKFNGKNEDRTVKSVGDPKKA